MMVVMKTKSHRF